MWPLLIFLTAFKFRANLLPRGMVVSRFLCKIKGSLLFVLIYTYPGQIAGENVKSNKPADPAGQAKLGQERKPRLPPCRNPANPPPPTGNRSQPRRRLPGNPAPAGGHFPPLKAKNSRLENRHLNLWAYLLPRPAHTSPAKLIQGSPLKAGETPRLTQGSLIPYPLFR